MYFFLFEHVTVLIEQRTSTRDVTAVQYTTRIIWRIFNTDFLQFIFHFDLKIT